MATGQQASCEAGGGSIFARERATFEAHKPDLLAAHQGEFVVIKGENIAGVWPTYEEALRVGYSRFGLSSFYVKQILAVDPVATITREILPCRI